LKAVVAVFPFTVISNATGCVLFFDSQVSSYSIYFLPLAATVLKTKVEVGNFSVPKKSSDFK
jgi:hypothetical protein